MADILCVGEKTNTIFAYIVLWLESEICLFSRKIHAEQNLYGRSFYGGLCKRLHKSNSKYATS